MSAETLTTAQASTPRPRTWMIWTGRVLTGLSVIGLGLSAAMKLSQQQEMIDQFVKIYGYNGSTLLGIGVLELLCVIVYAIPRTTVLGAVLLTGYLGGAIATHVRIGEPFVAPLVLGLLVWAGVALRSGELRGLLPLVRR